MANLQIHRRLPSDLIAQVSNAVHCEGDLPVRVDTVRLPDGAHLHLLRRPAGRRQAELQYLLARDVGNFDEFFSIFIKIIIVYVVIIMKSRTL